MHLDERTRTLKAELERLKQDKDRPSISARARASLLLVELTEATGNESALRDVLNDFKTLFEDSKRLLNFPLGGAHRPLHGDRRLLSDQRRVR